MEDLTDAAPAHRYPMGVQLFAQLGQRTVRLRPYPITQLLLDRRRDPTQATVPGLRLALHPSAQPPLPAYLAHVLKADSKAPR
jgi:hypothetical protein